MDLDALGFVIDEEYEAMAEEVESVWNDAFESFNPGQQAQYEDYIEPALQEWLADAADDWPYVDSIDYVDRIAGSTDIWQDAFSDTTDASATGIDHHAARAQVMQDLADFADVFF